MTRDDEADCTLTGAISAERTSPIWTSIARTVPRAGDFSGVPAAARRDWALSVLNDYK